MATYGQRFDYMPIDRNCNPICKPADQNITATNDVNITATNDATVTASNDVNISANNDINMDTTSGDINLSPAAVLNIRPVDGIGLEVETVEPVATATPNIFTVTFVTNRPVKNFPFGGAAVAVYQPLPAGGSALYRIQSPTPKSVLSVSVRSSVGGSGTKDLTVHAAEPTAGNSYDIAFGNTDNAAPINNFGGIASVLEYSAL